MPPRGYSDDARDAVLSLVDTAVITIAAPWGMASTPLAAYYFCAAPLIRTRRRRAGRTPIATDASAPSSYDPRTYEQETSPPPPPERRFQRRPLYEG